MCDNLGSPCRAVGDPTLSVSTRRGAHKYCTLHYFTLQTVIALTNAILSPSAPHYCISLKVYRAELLRPRENNGPGDVPNSVVGFRSRFENCILETSGTNRH